MPRPFRLRIILCAIIFLALCLLLYYRYTPAHVQWRSPAPSDLSTPSSAGEASIPKRIWQTAANCPLAPAPNTNLTVNEDDPPEKRLEAQLASWLQLNPDWAYECLSDESAAAWVREHFHVSKEDEALPDEKMVVTEDGVDWVGRVYLALQDRILKADLLRYLVLYIQGGLYTDLDTSCLQPIASWADPSLLTNASVIVGIESDRHPVENDWKLYSDDRPYIWGITNWTFASKPRHPLLRAVVHLAGKRLLALARGQGKPLSQMNVMYKDVIQTTGPRAFSEGFLAYMARALGKNDKGHQPFSMLEEPNSVADGVLVLPIRMFSVMEANRADGEGARSLSVEPVVRHWSDGTWKKDHFIDDRPRKPPEGREEVVKAEGGAGLTE